MKNRMQQLMPDGTWADMDGNPCERLTGEVLVVSGRIVREDPGHYRIWTPNDAGDYEGPK